MLRKVLVDHEYLSIDPRAEGLNDAEIKVLVVDDRNSPLSGVDVTVHVNRGAVSVDGREWALRAYSPSKDGVATFTYTCDRRRIPGVTPGLALITVLTSVSGLPTNVDSSQIVVIGPPASVTMAAAPATLRPGELVTLTATIRDAIGQEVVDGTEVIFQATPEGQLVDTHIRSRRGSCTTFLLTSLRHEGIYSIIASVDGLSATVSVLTKSTPQTVA
jgi:hypothetical protein